MWISFCIPRRVCVRVAAAVTTINPISHWNLHILTQNRSRPSTSASLKGSLSHAPFFARRSHFRANALKHDPGDTEMTTYHISTTPRHDSAITNIPGYLTVHHCFHIIQNTVISFAFSQKRPCLMVLFRRHLQIMQF